MRIPEMFDNQNKEGSDHFAGEFYAHFKVFHELMSHKVRDILLVSTPYDAFIMEEDGSLASRIINEYRGLNLSHPPRVTRTSSPYTAIELISHKKYDLVLTMPHLEGMDAYTLAREIKSIWPELPVILLAHSARAIEIVPDEPECREIENTFIWSGNSDLLLALVKNVEDKFNVYPDTRKAMVRVLLLVEDSPVCRSSILPLLYKEVVKQTQAVLSGGLNEEHRLLRMRARPKILLAETYEEAVEIYEKYHPYLFGVISDTRFPRNCIPDDDAGVSFLSRIRQETPDIPLLLMSSQPENRERAKGIPAEFLDKNAANLLDDIHSFFINHLGFGDFVFRTPDGKEIARARNLRTLAARLSDVPEESVLYHASRNHFSNWIMGRSEVILASWLRDLSVSDFENVEAIRNFIIKAIHNLRKWRQRGIVAQFKPHNYDADIIDFAKIGDGSLGGKARGLAFMSALWRENPEIFEKYHNINLMIPQTLVITTEGFESFISQNRMKPFSLEGDSDEKIKQTFISARMPLWITQRLEIFLKQVHRPLSVRSSSLLEDAQFHPYAGIYETCMIPNNSRNLKDRLSQLITAVKLVYASTWFAAARAFSKSISSQFQSESMAVIIQELTGVQQGAYFYPTFSGVGLSHNYYPVSPMTCDDGVVHVALGFGKTVVEGEKSLRFSPGYPEVLPQFSDADAILENSQRYFYALKTQDYPEEHYFDRTRNLVRREVDEAEEESPVLALSSTYIPEEHRIRDTAMMPGPKVITFSQILKYNLFPLSGLLQDLLALGKKGMGNPVEIEFSGNIRQNTSKKSDFAFLQIRPMVTGPGLTRVSITEPDIKNAFCYSQTSLGNGIYDTIRDLVYVIPEAFDISGTKEMAGEINKINKDLESRNTPCLLAGPGRWGSRDRFLGIPVEWQDISQVGAFVELRNHLLRVDPSQGSHFFQNITSMDIPYLTVTEGDTEFFQWDIVLAQEVVRETAYIRHVRFSRPFVIKVSGRDSLGVILARS